MKCAILKKRALRDRAQKSTTYTPCDNVQNQNISAEPSSSDPMNLSASIIPPTGHDSDMASAVRYLRKVAEDTAASLASAVVVSSAEADMDHSGWTTYNSIKRKVIKQVLNPVSKVNTRRHASSLDRQTRGGRFDPLLNLSDSEEGIGNVVQVIEVQDSQIIDLEASPNLEALLSQASFGGPAQDAASQFACVHPVVVPESQEI